MTTPHHSSRHAVAMRKRTIFLVVLFRYNAVHVMAPDYRNVTRVQSICINIDNSTCYSNNTYIIC